jgi:hypothetical protein
MKLKVALTIDVEEEGLFSGAYPSHTGPIENLRELSRLTSLITRRGIRPTLLVTYSVATNPAGMRVVREIAKEWDAEIGAHLHHWNTPPLYSSPHRDPAPAETLPQDILNEKAAVLLRALRNEGVEPSSFRMGRFSFGPKTLAAVKLNGFTVDSSVAPMRRFYGGPDHIAAPRDPYYPDPEVVTRAGSSETLEVPITVVPIHARVPALLDAAESRGLLSPGTIARVAETVGSFPVQPMWTGLRRMLLGALLHHAQGGRIITMFFHSSELMPGASPKHPTESHVNAFISKLDRYFAWLQKSFHVDFSTLRELHASHEFSGR